MFLFDLILYIWIEFWFIATGPNTFQISRTTKRSINEVLHAPPHVSMSPPLTGGVIGFERIPKKIPNRASHADASDSKQVDERFHSFANDN